MKITYWDSDGGPAFPATLEGESGTLLSSKGMSLRDYFAGQALAGITSDPDWLEGPASWQRMAAHSYAIADAMLAARSRKQEG